MTGLSWRKKREIEFVRTLLRHLGRTAQAIEPSEKGGDAVVTLAGGTRVLVEVTEPHLTDDGDPPQARANRWLGLWRILQDGFEAKDLVGLLYVEFGMDGGWPSVPPSRTFQPVSAEILRYASGWDRKSEFCFDPPAGSPLSPWVRRMTLSPSPIRDISSNHMGAFISMVESEDLFETIRKKVGKPADDGPRWLLIVIGVGLHQPAGTPQTLGEDPDPDRTFERIFVYDGLHDALFEKVDREWRRTSTRASTDEPA